ncbi:MAG: methylmalonyl-CoA epimerase [Thermoplasmatota archaeon]
MKILKVEHLGIAVADLDAASRFFSETLGLPLSKREVLASQEVKIAFHPVGETKLELLASTTPEGPIARHIEKRGTGIQHVAFHVADIRAAMQELRAKKVRLLSEEPEAGAEGSLVCFLHPKDSAGVLVELVEMPRPAGTHGPQ